MNKAEFERIIWPAEFCVQFTDGQEQLFVSGEGLTWDAGNNNEGENENRPSISCCWQKKSPSQQRYKLIEFFADKVAAIKTTNGSQIWAANV
jgi:hypothetical protein